MSARSLGIVYGLMACVLWGITFVIPRVLHEASPVLVTLCRYLVFGSFSLGILIYRRKEVVQTITKKHLKMSFFLSIMSNSLYYVLAVIGLRLVGVPFGSLVIGLVPITLVLFGKEGTLNRKMYESCALILVGLLCLNYQVFAGDTLSTESQFMKLVGVVVVFMCLTMWTIYGIQNGRYLKSHPEIRGGIWTSLIGLMSLLSLLSMLPILIPLSGNPFHEWESFGTDVRTKIIFWSLLSGLVSSWFAYTMWNKASKLLPTSFLGQIVVVETMSAITADHIIDRSWPSAMTMIAVVFILSGTYWGMKNSSPK